MRYRIFWIVGVLSELGMTLALTGCSNHRVLLAGEDVITFPGQTVEIKARLQQRNIPLFKDMEKVPIHFRLTSSPPQSHVTLDEQKLTGEEGEASVFLPIPKEGIYKIDVFYEGSERFESKIDEITILAIDSAQPIAVFDLDYTLTKQNWINKPQDIEPHDQDTVRVINDLSQKYAIVYLSGRPKPVHRSTRKWLKMNSFPDGPILLWYPTKFRWLSTQKYKKDTLLTLRDAGFNLVLGVGDRESDTKAYRQAGMKAVVLPPNGKRHKTPSTDPNIIHVSNWQELGSMVLEHE